MTTMPAEEATLFKVEIKQPIMKKVVLSAAI
jgi:hypothetical protein